MKYLRKFESVDSKKKFEQSDLDEIKSYFQDIEDEIGIKVKISHSIKPIVGEKINVTISIGEFLNKKMRISRHAQSGLMISMLDNFDKELIDTYENLSNFYKLLSLSLKQVSNNPEYLIKNQVNFLSDPIIINIVLR
jgi:hypothetical protein